MRGPSFPQHPFFKANEGRLPAGCFSFCLKFGFESSASNLLISAHQFGRHSVQFPTCAQTRELSGLLVSGGASAGGMFRELEQLVARTPGVHVK